MSVTYEEDEARIDAVRRWHIFNRDPSDEHYRNIDTMLAELAREDERVDTAQKDAEEKYRDEILDLESKVSGLESYICRLEESNEELLAKDDLTGRRCILLEKIAFALVRRLDGERGVEALIKKLEDV